MPKPLNEQDYLERAIETKRRRIRLLESEIAALEELLAVLRKTEEVLVDAQQH